VRNPARNWVMWKHSCVIGRVAGVCSGDCLQPVVAAVSQKRYSNKCHVIEKHIINSWWGEGEVCVHLLPPFVSGIIEMISIKLGFKLPLHWLPAGTLVFVSLVCEAEIEPLILPTNFPSYNGQFTQVTFQGVKCM
jgi:hypothetical protein